MKKNWKLRTGLAAGIGATGMLAAPIAAQAVDTGSGRDEDRSDTRFDASCENDGLLGGLFGNGNGNGNDGLLGGLFGNGNGDDDFGDGRDDGILEIFGSGNNNRSSFEPGDNCNLSFGSTNTNTRTTGSFGNDTDDRDRDRDDDNSLLNLGS